jgi:serine/threonine protein kinase
MSNAERSGNDLLGRARAAHPSSRGARAVRRGAPADKPTIISGAAHGSRPGDAPARRMLPLTPVDPSARRPVDRELAILAPLELPPASAGYASRLPIVPRENYEPLGLVAAGGIGRIRRARDERLDRQVALKELLYEADPAAEERFVREALITARLTHPGIIPVYEAGRWPSGEPFYAMKLVSGRSLADVIEAAPTLAERLALVPHVRAVAEAVAYAHSKHIIHRDLKPANILVGEFGETVVIDWGLAKDLSRRGDPGAPRSAPSRRQPLDAYARAVSEAESLTMLGAVIGTPAYMPPEQASGQPVDQRADVYAIGAILHHVLAGRPPYGGPTPGAILRGVLKGPPPIPRGEQPIAHDLLAIVQKAMARDPAARYPSARELADDLRRFQTGQIVGAHTYSPAARCASATSPTARSTHCPVMRVRSPRWPSRPTARSSPRRGSTT